MLDRGRGRRALGALCGGCGAAALIVWFSLVYIVHETVKAAIILAILERLCLTRPVSWLEEHIDYLCVVRLRLESRPCCSATHARWSVAAARVADEAPGAHAVPEDRV